MWRRFSSSSAESNPPTKQTSPTSKDTPPAAPSPVVTALPKSGALAAAQSGPQPQPGSVKEHDLPTQRPAGWGQRRRSSILERLTRESTKEGMTRHSVFVIMIDQ